MDTPSTKKEKTPWWLLLILVAVVLLMWGAYWLLIKSHLPWNVGNDNIGIFGDSFGALTALFSGLAFGGLIFTIILQGCELRLQREELKLQREEMVLQRKEMEENRKEQKGQRIAMQTQNELNVLSARLSALPILIQQKVQEIRAVNSSFRNWEEKYGTALQEYKDNLRERIPSFQQSYQEEYREAIDKIEELQTIEKDLKFIYNDLKRRAEVKGMPPPQ